MQRFIYSICTSIVNQFGFSNLDDFFLSMFHTKLLAYTISTAAIIATLESWFGFPSVILASFVIMAGVELISGLWASRVKKIKWESKKVGRFGFKLCVWMLLIFVANSFKNAYIDDKGIPSQIAYQIFSWFHGMIVVYVCLEYIISIIENLSAITGQTNNKLLRFLNRKMDKILGETIYETQAEQKKSLTAISNIVELEQALDASQIAHQEKKNSNENSPTSSEN